MADYQKLIETIRFCGSGRDTCDMCPMQSELNPVDCQTTIMLKAADAIEEPSMKIHGYEAAIAGMKREIERMVVAGKPRWIPVTERLPEEYVPVLVYLFGDSPYIAWINHEGEWETEEFTIDHDYLPQAWMPLPEPPKEENNAKNR